MGRNKFNLNQILNDASKCAADGGAGHQPATVESRIEKISVFDLVPSEENFYSMREIEELKAAIEIAGKVMQNLVVVPLDGGKYKVIAGHRRRLASLSLVEEGKPQYEFVPCDIEPNEAAAEDQEIRDGLLLIVTNSQRDKTAWDKIEEVRYLREVLEKAKTKPRFVDALREIVATAFVGGTVQADGTRDFIAKVLHASPAQIGRFDAIIRNLCPEFKAELREDRINVSTAYELSGLSAEDQRAAFEKYKRSGTFSIRDARERKQTEPPAPSITAERPEAPAEPPRAATQPAEAPRRESVPTAAGTPHSAEKAAQRAAEAHQAPHPANQNTPAAYQATAEAEQEAPEAERDPLKQLEDLLAFCMDKSERFDTAREWGADVDALLYALNIVREGRADE